MSETGNAHSSKVCTGDRPELRRFRDEYHHDPVLSPRRPTKTKAAGALPNITSSATGGHGVAGRSDLGVLVLGA